jgi:hypothetical protein
MPDPRRLIDVLGEQSEYHHNVPAHTTHTF